ncbi:hypothetical protein ACFV23_15860 [Streptomyces sp. NPDC059627]
MDEHRGGTACHRAAGHHAVPSGAQPAVRGAVGTPALQARVVALLVEHGERGAVGVLQEEELLVVGHAVVRPFGVVVDARCRVDVVAEREVSRGTGHTACVRAEDAAGDVHERVLV